MQTNLSRKLGMVLNLAAGFQSLPVEYQNVVRLAQERNQIAITPLQALTGGWSGAIVFLVSIASQNPDRVEHYILKLDRKNEKSQSDEIRRHEAAMRQSPPGFPEKHMAQMVFDRVEADNAMAIFYSIAGQSLHRYKTLSAYEKQSQVETIFTSTYQYVLNEWNTSCTFEQAVHPTSVLEQWLGFRLRQGSHIETFLETICRVPPEVTGYLVQDSILPNPLAYARHPDWWGNARPIDTSIGLQHGDLNTNNILIKFARDDETLDGYYLIDFALFKEKMPLVFDLRYLEMSYLILRQSQVSFAKLVDLIVHLGEVESIDPQQVPIDVAGVCTIIRAARQAFGRWVDQRYPSLHDDLWGQYWLAGVAAGLSYCHKASIDQQQRLAGLLFAAANLKRYAALFGLPAPVEARQLYNPGQISQDRLTAITTRKALHNLPAQMTSLIGREDEVALVQKLLTSEDTRLVTLTGPGGVGKTRLSLEVAAHISNSFPDGVFFISLADISDPELVVPKIAQILEVREGGGQPLIETVKGFLQDKRMLLVLDNFEQVIAATALVTELLTASAQLKILVSSRIVLQIRGEQEFAVPPLETPNPTQLKTIEQLEQNQSVQLFVERAQAVQSKFVLTPENVTAVAEICQRLDGLPLAIELAAARVKLLPPQAMLSRLNNRLGLLTGGARDLPIRQQTLRNSLDLSYSLLRPEEQILFARLGVFVGGFELETAEAVCNADGTLDILEGVTSLMNNSLLRSEEGANGQPRFRMLETIREYALEHLTQRSELTAMQQAHAHYYFTKIAGESNKLFSRESLMWLDWLESEHGNIGAALAWGLSSLSAAEFIPLIIFQLSWYWYRRGYLNEGRTWSDRVLNSPLAAERTPGRAWTLQSNAMLAMWQGDLHTASARAIAGLELAQQLEDTDLVSLAFLTVGVVSINRGDDTAAYKPLQEAQAIFNEEGLAFFYPITLVHLGNVALGLGKPAEARAWHEQAYTVSRDLGEGWTHSFVLNNLGEVARVQGDYEAARRYYEESESLLRSMGDKGDLARLIHNLGYVAQHEQNLPKAKAQFKESLAIFRALGNKRGITECLAAFASLEAIQGDAPLAAQLLGAAEATMKAAGAGWWPADRGEIERTRAILQSRLGEPVFIAEWTKGTELPLEPALARVAD